MNINIYDKVAFGIQQQMADCEVSQVDLAVSDIHKSTSRQRHQLLLILSKWWKHNTRFKPTDSWLMITVSQTKWITYLSNTTLANHVRQFSHIPTQRTDVQRTMEVLIYREIIRICWNTDVLCFINCTLELGSRQSAEDVLEFFIAQWQWRQRIIDLRQAIGTRCCLLNNSATNKSSKLPWPCTRPRHGRY